MGGLVREPIDRRETMDSQHDEPLAWARRPARALILGWSDSCGVDVGNEEADDLARRIHDAAIPFDGDAETIERCVTDAIHFLADRVEHDGAAAELLRKAAADLSAAFVDAGLVAEPRCIQAATANAEGGPSPGSTLPEREEPHGADIAPSATRDSQRPRRLDFIFAKPVDVRLIGGQRGQVRHAPFDGRVKVTGLPDRAMLASLDDLTERSRAALTRAPVRRRVEVHVRCSRRSCGQVFRGWLTERHTVENTDGEVICSHADLFTGLCPEHRRTE